jgi:hypothetical protein
VIVSGNTYNLVRRYRLSGDVSDTTDILESVDVGSNLNLIPDAEIFFERGNGGETGMTTYTLLRVAGGSGRQVQIYPNGVIEVIRL